MTIDRRGRGGSPEDERCHRQLELVDEPGLEQRCHERAAAFDHQARHAQLGDRAEGRCEVDATGPGHEHDGVLGFERRDSRAAGASRGADEYAATAFVEEGAVRDRWTRLHWL